MIYIFIYFLFLYYLFNFLITIFLSSTISDNRQCYANYKVTQHCC